MHDRRAARRSWATTPDGLYIAYQDLGDGPAALVVINGMYSHIEVYWEWPQFARFVRTSRDEPPGAALRPPRHGHVRPRHGRPDVEPAWTTSTRCSPQPASSEPRSTAGARRRRWRRSSLPPTRRGHSPCFSTASCRLKWAPGLPLGDEARGGGGVRQPPLPRSGATTTTLSRSASSRCGDRPEDGPWHDEAFVRVHAKLMRDSRRPPAAFSPSRARSTRPTPARSPAPSTSRPRSCARRRPRRTSDVSDEDQRELGEYNASLIPGRPARRPCRERLSSPSSTRRRPTPTR